MSEKNKKIQKLIQKIKQTNSSLDEAEKITFEKIKSKKAELLQLKNNFDHNIDVYNRIIGVLGNGNI